MSAYDASSSLLSSYLSSSFSSSFSLSSYPYVPVGKELVKDLKLCFQMSNVKTLTILTRHISHSCLPCKYTNQVETLQKVSCL